jgi:hypothetical protein
MSTRIRDEFRKELLDRGFTAALEAPHGTIGLTDSYFTSADLADLLEVMVARREKIFRSVDVVGANTARQSYEDVVLVIEATKAVIGRLAR